MFLDCAAAVSGDPKHAALTWVHTAGACLLELLDRDGTFADHEGPAAERGVPGWHVISSGAVGSGLDSTENRRLQEALMEANVLHRIADSFTADLESPFFNGVKVFIGGRPGAMQAEIRVNGERHEAASAALAGLALPVPATFTAVRYYALLLPLPADGGEPAYPSVRLELGDGHAHTHEDVHAHGTGCGCGRELNPEHPGFEFALPHLLAELSEQERAECVRADTGVVMIAEGVGNFFKVRLPIRLEDGRTLIYLAWVYLEAEVIDEVGRRARGHDLEGRRFEGLFCNAIDPWGEDLLRAPVIFQGRPATAPGAIGYCEVVESSHPVMNKVLTQHWPAESVLGDKDPRQRTGT
jgi:hypothetical protein